MTTSYRAVKATIFFRVGLVRIFSWADRVTTPSRADRATMLLSVGKATTHSRVGLELTFFMEGKATTSSGAGRVTIEFTAGPETIESMVARVMMS